MNGGAVTSGALSIISAMVTPALTILAAASLASSALLRMGCVVDRARLLTAMVHEGRLDTLGASPDVVAGWLKTYGTRAQRTALAVFSLYAAIVLFLGACLLIGVQHLGANLPDYAALVLVLPGTLFFFAGAMWMAGETGASRTLVIEEIDNALERLESNATG